MYSYRMVFASQLESKLHSIGIERPLVVTGEDRVCV